MSKIMERYLFAILLCLAFVSHVAAAGKKSADDDYYTEPKVYSSRPSVNKEMDVKNVGPTGIIARIYKGVILKVDGVEPGTPATGKFKKGDVITGVNGVVLKGKNPFVVLGNAITAAEASNGKLTFDVSSKGKVSITIPILGAYSKTWPLNCAKSKKIIDRAAKFYSKSIILDKNEDTGIPSALACLFLLSTGDDQYLPPVRNYFHKMAENVEGIGDHTWNNGYNGIACAENYLRPGTRLCCRFYSTCVTTQRNARCTFSGPSTSSW